MCCDYVAFDLETTGLRPMQDRILEIGAVKVENGDVLGTFEVLIDHKIPIPPEITRLTGISEEMTAGAPDLRTAVEAFLEFSGDSVLLGHNVIFDYSFMKRSVVNLGGVYERMGLDTLTIARACLPKPDGKALDKLAEWYRIPQEQHHRALDDAMTAARLFERLREEFQESRPDLFVPVPLSFKIKKEAPITNSQKVYLRDLIKYHRIESNVKIDQLTRSEASRMIDGIILRYGKIAGRGDTQARRRSFPDARREESVK